MEENIFNGDENDLDNMNEQMNDEMTVQDWTVNIGLFLGLL